MYCKYCGAQLAEDSVFCHSCGKRYKAVSNKKKIPELDEKREYVDVDAYIKNMNILQKACLLFVMSAAAMWAAILVLGFFIPIR